MIILKYLTMSKKMGDTVCFLKIQFVAKYQKNEGRTLWRHRVIFEKKSHKAKTGRESLIVPT